MPRKRTSAADRENTRDSSTLTNLTEEHWGLDWHELDNNQLPDDAIVKQEDGTLSFAGVLISRRGIADFGDITQIQWQTLGDYLANLNTSIQWLIGDWLVHGENQRYGSAKELAERLGRTDGSLHQYAYVARRIEFSIRIENLSFGHHQVVASMDTQSQTQWLEKAKNEGWSVAQLRKAIKIANKGISQLPSSGIERHSYDMQKWYHKIHKEALSSEYIIQYIKLLEQEIENMQMLRQQLSKTLEDDTENHK
jgi:hypothetical protein